MSEHSADACRARIEGTVPSREALVEALGECQDLFGRIQHAASDRNPNRAADIARLTRLGMSLCIAARAADPP